MVKKHKRIVTTNTLLLIVLSFILVAVLVFSIITALLRAQLAEDITNRSNQYIEAIVRQIEWRLSNSLYNFDFAIQRLTNDLQVQSILQRANLQDRRLTAEDHRMIRVKIVEMQLYTEGIQNVEIYSHTRNLFPGTQLGINDRVCADTLAEANRRNGAVFWYVDDDYPNLIFGIRRIFLSEFNFENAGYVLFSISDDFLHFLQQEFIRIEGGAIVIRDVNSNVFLQYESTYFNFPTDDLSDYFDSITIRSRDNNWFIDIYTPRTLLEESLAWLGRLMFITFSIGIVLLALGGSIIAHFIRRPIQDMKTFMERSSWPLVTNDKQYFNSDINILNHQFNSLVDRCNLLIEEKISEEHFRAIAELKALEAQVNPHFIINALESIYWSLIGENKVESANIVLSLAKLFRYILKAEDWLPLNDELDFIRQYMQIEQFRFSDRLTCTITADDKFLNKQIPKLLIQPLVENAVKHGAEKSSGAVTIQVKVFQDGDKMVIYVNDDGVGISSETMATIQKSFQKDMPVGSVSSSYGLANLKKRLQTYYGDHADLMIQSNDQHPGTTVTITLSSLIADEPIGLSS